MSLRISHGLALPDDTITKTLAILAKRRVGKTYTKLLSALIGVYPNAMAKADLARAAGVSSSSSSFANNVSALRSLGLIDYPSPGMVAAQPVLMLERQS